MDAEKIQGLVEMAASAGGLAEAHRISAEALAAKGLAPFPTNACALTLSALLRNAGIDVPLTFGAGSLARKLGGPPPSRGWVTVPVGHQQPGDVGVCFDNTAPPGADHVYLVVQPQGPDRMLIADNQHPTVHERYASGRGRTPTDYFLRAPGSDAMAIRIHVPSDPWNPAGSATTAANALPGDPLAAAAVLAAQSAVAKYAWRDRGVAPVGFVKGMAAAYVVLRAKLAFGDAATLASCAPAQGQPDTDALAWLAQEFSGAGMAAPTDPPAVLRHLFVLLMGLGMRESSGRYCEGRDQAVNNVTGETAEAGLFQTSYNARTAHPAMADIYARSLGRTDLVEVFSEGVPPCSAADLQDFGDGEGARFQHLSKRNPLFAVEFAALGVRHRRKHWGPINQKKLELLAQANRLFAEIDGMLDARAMLPNALN